MNFPLLIFNNEDVVKVESRSESGVTLRLKKDFKLGTDMDCLEDLAMKDEAELVEEVDVYSVHGSEMDHGLFEDCREMEFIWG